MPTPVLIDTDMGVDDAVAIALAQASPQIDLVGIVSVGGNVSCAQATANIGRVIHAFRINPVPLMARGLDQADGKLGDASHVFGSDGLGEMKLKLPKVGKPIDHVKAYEKLIAQYGKALVIIAIGPLTNLAALLKARPGLLEQAGRVVVMGGAVWCRGNVTPHAEFNFYRDPQAAKDVLEAGLDVTVVSLDVTTQVLLDESHAAHLSRSGTPVGEVLAEMMAFPMQREGGVRPGTFIIHDALAVGVLIWPAMFLRSKMALEITTSGEQSGKCKPLVTKESKRKVAVVISAKTGDFIESMLEQICHERFVV